MKKTVILAFSAAIMFLSVSCTKTADVTPVTQTVEASIKSNETYSFVLPTNTSSSFYQITTQAVNSSVSQIVANTDGSIMYQYTPAANFTGTEDIVISNAEETHTCGERNNPPNPKPLKGDCKSHAHTEDAGKIIKIRLNILPGTK
jgi:hypothetical protein